MRKLAMLFGGLLVLSTLTASDARAGKGDDDDKKKKKKDEGIELTGIDAFDSVFSRVSEIDSLLSDVDAQLRTGKHNLNLALDLKKGTPISDGLAELQERAGGKLTAALNEQGIPQLTAADAVPTDVQSAIDAVNGLTANLTTSLTDVQNLVPELDKIGKDVQKMPDRLKDEFANQSGTDLLDTLFTLPKTTKALTHDIDVTTGLADRTTSLTGRMTDILGTVQQQFPAGAAAPAGAHPVHPAPTTTPSKNKTTRKYPS
jgi:hypothetical protein